MPGTATNREMIIECVDTLHIIKREVIGLRKDLREIKAEISKHAIIEEKLKKGENTDKTTGWFMFF
jgi:prefoldin subunit 5